MGPSAALTFGLITIPVGLYTATEDRDISFHLLSAKDKSRIVYKRVSSKTGREVDWDNIVKGYEYEKGKHVIFTPEELDQIAPESARAIDVIQFVDAAEIEPIYFEKSYLVAPTKVAVKAYALFARALSESDRVAIGKVAIREKERLCTLRVRDGLVILETMNWPDEIRVPEFEQLDSKPRISAEELKTARTLIDQLTGKFEPANFEDSYRHHVLEAIDAKIEGNEITIEQTEAPAAEVTDLPRGPEGQHRGDADQTLRLTPRMTRCSIGVLTQESEGGPIAPVDWAPLDGSRRSREERSPSVIDVDYPIPRTVKRLFNPKV